MSKVHENAIKFLQDNPECRFIFIGERPEAGTSSFGHANQDFMFEAISSSLAKYGELTVEPEERPDLSAISEQEAFRMMGFATMLGEAYGMADIPLKAEAIEMLTSVIRVLANTDPKIQLPEISNVSPSTGIQFHQGDC